MYPEINVTPYINKQMKNKFSLLSAFCTLVITALLLGSCNANQPEGALCSNRTLVNSIEKYVTCPSDSVEMMLASSDSTFLQLDSCSLEFLNLYDERANLWLDSLYHQDIPTILKIYATYDVMTNFPVGEANAAFAWHEVANTLIAEHFGTERADSADVNYVWRVVDEILGAYGAGTQSEMNVSAWRWVMVSDYWLIDAYKTLFDTCNDPSLLPSVHRSYINLLSMYRNRRDQLEGYWSDQPRELARMLTTMMEEQREKIEHLTRQYREGTLDTKAVKATLDKVPEDTEWDIYDY